MKALWISAHPESGSLNGALRDEGLRALKDGGHEFRESDLYAMGWKPTVDQDDFPHERDDRLLVAKASKHAYLDGTLSEDIRLEQEKLDWADTLVIQFPLWWFGMPAMLKGWFDRVFVKGYAYGVRDPETGRTLRYGSGGLAGKRALIVATVGAPVAESFGPRGIHGDLADVLWPVTHGIFWYSGIASVEPMVVFGADRVSGEAFEAAAAELRERVLTLPTAPAIPYRHENSSDYDEKLVLRSDIAPGRTGTGIHIR